MDSLTAAGGIEHHDPGYSRLAALVDAQDAGWFLRHPEAHERTRPSIDGEFFGLDGYRGRTHVVRIDDKRHARVALDWPK